MCSASPPSHLSVGAAASRESGWAHWANWTLDQVFGAMRNRGIARFANRQLPLSWANRCSAALNLVECNRPATSVVLRIPSNNDGTRVQKFQRPHKIVCAVSPSVTPPSARFRAALMVCRGALIGRTRPASKRPIVLALSLSPPSEPGARGLDRNDGEAHARKCFESFSPCAW
jgi:hypothetical protein